MSQCIQTRAGTYTKHCQLNCIDGDTGWLRRHRKWEDRRDPHSEENKCHHVGHDDSGQGDDTRRQSKDRRGIEVGSGSEMLRNIAVRVAVDPGNDNKPDHLHQTGVGMGIEIS
jgi:hypothetical protein